MRIAFLTTQWPGARLGGIGAYTLSCARELAAQGHEPHVFTLKLPEDVRRAVPSGIILHEIDDLAARVQEGILPGELATPLYTGGEALYRLALAAILCDAVRSAHAATPFNLIEGPEYEALALPLLLNPIPDLPVVTQLHSNSAIRRLGNAEPASPAQLLIESLEFATLLSADALCAPSNAVVKDTRDLCPFDRAVEIIGLPMPAPTASFEPPLADSPILYVGRLEQLKGMCVLAKALGPFLARCPKSRVRLVGPDTATAPGGGSMADWMRRQIDPALLPRVEFVGERTSAELTAEYRGAAFCVVPSLFESYSLVACEALAAGRIVVVSAGIGAAEVVGNAGIAFPRGDAAALAAAMINCVENPLLIAEFSRSAFQRARKILSAQTTMPKRLDFYHRVITAFRPHDRAAALQKLPHSHIPALVQALARLAGSLAGIADPSHPTPGTRLLNIMNRAGTPHAAILLYGAGRHTARLLGEKHLWERAGHRVIGLIDDHPRFAQQPSEWGLPVESAAALAARLPLGDANIVVVLSTDTFQDQFWRQTELLRAKGIRVYKLYD